MNVTDHELVKMKKAVRKKKWGNGGISSLNVQKRKPCMATSYHQRHAFTLAWKKGLGNMITQSTYMRGQYKTQKTDPIFFKEFEIKHKNNF